MTNCNIKFVQGHQSGPPVYVKFFVKGFGEHAKPIPHPSNDPDRNHRYQCYLAQVQAGYVFSIQEIHEVAGRKKTTFKICVVGGMYVEYHGEYGEGFCNGSYAIIAEAEGDDSDRLMELWILLPPGADPVTYSRSCSVRLKEFLPILVR